MKNFVLCTLVFIVIGISTLFADPKIEIIGGDTYNWGVIKGSENQLKAKVQIKNTGDELLKITNVKPTCGCTTAPLDKNELRPGEVATLDITLNVGGRSGEITKSIRIESSDPNAKEKVLWLKCNLVPDFEISPNKYLSFQEMTVGMEKETKVTLKNNSKEVIKLSDFTVEPENLSINLKGSVSLKPGQSLDLVAKVTPKEPGNLKGTVKFKTTNANEKDVTLNAFGRVKESPIFNNSK